MNYNIIESKIQWSLSVDTISYILYDNPIGTYRNLDTVYSKLPRIYNTKDNITIYSTTPNEKIYLL